MFLSLCADLKGLITYSCCMLGGLIFVNCGCSSVQLTSRLTLVMSVVDSALWSPAVELQNTGKHREEVSCHKSYTLKSGNGNVVVHKLFLE